MTTVTPAWIRDPSCIVHHEIRHHLASLTFSFLLDCHPQTLSHLYDMTRDLKVVDVLCAHPSISKQHAVMQVRCSLVDVGKGSTAGAIWRTLLIGKLNTQCNSCLIPSHTCVGVVCLCVSVCVLPPCILNASAIDEDPTHTELQGGLRKCCNSWDRCGGEHSTDHFSGGQSH